MKNRTADLAQSITRASSKQTYFTARLMVDQNLELDCYRAYSYFRWVDDVIDIDCQTKADRLTFVQRQKSLFQSLYRAETCINLSPEEEILADLIRNDRGKCYRLKSYIRNFLSIIEFDAERKGRIITQGELDWYASTLGKAVTDGILYFVCNGYPYPESANRYLAATGAHISHMLRDMAEDIQAGYFNIPDGKIEINQIGLPRIDSPSMQVWVKARVQLARQYFSDGKKYLDELPVLRCRIVGYWYCARFEHLLDTIEHDGYVLRSTYMKPKKLITWLKFAGIALVQTGRYALYHIQHDSEFCGRSKNLVENSYDVIPD